MRSHVHIYLCVRNADDPFCSKTVAKSTKPDSLALAPEFFYCHDSEKYSRVIFNRASAGGEHERCDKMVSLYKEYWPVIRREADAADFKRFFATCCARTSMYQYIPYSLCWQCKCTNLCRHICSGTQTTEGQDIQAQKDDD